MTDTNNMDEQRPQLFSSEERLRLARRKHLLIALEVDCRAPLTALAKEVRAPISTVFDDLKAIRRDNDFIILPKSASADTIPSGWLAIQRRREERQQRIIAALQDDPRAPMAHLARQLHIPLNTLANDMAAIRKRFTFTIEAKHGGGTNTLRTGTASPQDMWRSRENGLPEAQP